MWESMWDILIVKCSKILNRAHYMGWYRVSRRGSGKLTHVGDCTVWKHFAWHWGSKHRPSGNVIHRWLCTPRKLSFLHWWENYYYFIFLSQISCDLVNFVILFFSLGCLHTLGVIGPIFGYSLGSLCASLYVDIGLVNQGELQ